MTRAVWTAMLVLLAPAGARAWTDAHVRGVHAGVEVRPDGTARVSMELIVRIHAGWLEGLEVAGLDPGLTLDETKPPFAVSADDPELKFEPSVRTEGDRLAFAFRGRGGSPRAGTLRLGFVYTTDLAHRATAGRSDGTIRVRWTLPPWRSGLDAVSIAITAPAGAVRAEESDDDARATVGFERFDLGDRTLLLWQRSHLPRTVPWAVEIDVPEEAMDPALRAPALPPRPKLAGTVPEPEPPSRRGPIALAAALGVLAFLGRFTFARACARAGAKPRPLVPMPAWLFVPVVIGGTGWAAVGFVDHPALAVAALSAVALATLSRTPRMLARPPRLGRWRPASRRDLRRARAAALRRRAGLDAPVDLTTPAGLLLVGAGMVAALAVSAGAEAPPLFFASLGLLVVPALTATRFHLPSTPELSLAAVARLARRMPPGKTPYALSLVVHADGVARWQDARLRIVDPDPPEGLRSLDLAIAARSDLGGYQAEPVLLALVEAESEAARLLEDVDATRERARDRIALVVPARSLATVSTHLSARSRDGHGLPQHRRT